MWMDGEEYKPKKIGMDCVKNDMKEKGVSDSMTVGGMEEEKVLR